MRPFLLQTERSSSVDAYQLAATDDRWPTAPVVEKGKRGCLNQSLVRHTEVSGKDGLVDRPAACLIRYAVMLQEAETKTT